MNILNLVIAFLTLATSPSVTVDRIEENYAVIEIAQQDNLVSMKDVEINKFSSVPQESQILKTTTAIGTFTGYDFENGGAQFKSYDNEIWWFLKFEELNFQPKLNIPYAITYFENDTYDCACDYCDNCWREDDIFIHIEKIK